MAPGGLLTTAPAGTSWNQHGGVYHQRGPSFLQRPDFSLGIFAAQAWPQLFLVGSHPWCDGVARKQEWGLCPGAWNLVAASPSLKNRSQVSMVARNCARHLVSNHEQDRQALSSQGLHSRVCSSRAGAFLKACAQAPPPGVL